MLINNKIIQNNMKRGLNSQTITVLSIILVAIFFTSFQSPTGFATKLNIPSLAVSEETKNNTQTKITTPKQIAPFLVDTP